MIARTLAALGASALLLATPAFAQGELISAEVQVGDLNLATAQGQARLGRRVHKAMATICGAPPRTLKFAENYRSCRAEVMTDADAKIALLNGGTDRIQVAGRAR